MLQTPLQWLRLMRVHQWTKNAFVLTGVLFGHAWSNPALLTAALLAAAGFALVSSAVYILNDLIDREADRRHPNKRHRPIAAGTVKPAAAASFAALLAAAGLALALSASRLALAFVAAYALLNIAYSLRLKHVVILDVFVIAAGFMLRILAGTAGIGIPPSQWLIVCGLMITLFLGFAKRRAELMALPSQPGAHRRVLEHYDEPTLDTMIGITAAGAIIAYSLYTMDPRTVKMHGTDSLVYTVPVVVYATFRYIFLLHRRGEGGDPGALLLSDPHIVISVWAWLAAVIWLIG